VTDLIDTIDDFDPRAHAGDTATPFGLVIGEIPMGTLSEVAGIERATAAVELLEAADRNQDTAVMRLLGRSGRR
jgi:hypothetical protein